MPFELIKKHLVSIIGGSLILLVSIFIGIRLYDNRLEDEENLGLYRPDLLAGYQSMSYFKFDPRTILTSLEKGDTNVFTPMSEDDAYSWNEIPNLSIYWTQSDFLKIASILRQTVWDDPMSLKDWKVYDISLDGECGDPIGFYDVDITYFKTTGNSYITRHIQIEPIFGWVGLGDIGNMSRFPQPILRKWIDVDLSRAKITADDALRAVSEDVRTNFKIVDNFCSVWMLSWRFDPKNWVLDVSLGPDRTISYKIDLYTGNMIQKTK
jgi:hypothetical protein